ncbi:hypothetical protein [Bradyrhizobium zhanjiangense]|uniref:Uncharacterized protein n=1 Tax=Bradyrhizobium zhanjiangense TaxID=1325107 RepID=A0A4Q0QS40_9BRAD|nr:hypothetical protein [Bradyrhizobium zhanjiangense]RXG99347.1 hypothetical protein EAS61_11660 [Bradyrhizobium zhanjiangense]
MQRHPGDPQWIKVFASAEVAGQWFDQHDTEGVAWEYEIEGRQRLASIWIYLTDEKSRDIGNPGWARLFTSEQTAENWLEQIAPGRRIWTYPVEE